MENNRKEHIALSIGFVLILIVLIITLFRFDDFSSKNNSNLAQDSTPGVKVDNTPDYKTISSTDLQKQILTNNNKQGFTLLDIRSFDAYSQEHIVDSVNISPDEFPIGQQIDTHSQVIVIGQNSADGDIQKALDDLKKENFNNVVVLAGGMDTWKKFLGPTVTYGDPKSFVDQSKVSYLDPQDLNDAITSKAPLFIVDVRSNDDFNKGHITGAINIPFDTLEKDRSKITERRVVVVGANELQEFQASVQMYDMLLVSPFVMRTAMPGWQSKGFELVKS